MSNKIIVSLLCSVLLYYPGLAQKGFIYVHLRNVNEESTPSAGVTFSISGTATPPVTSFVLNDQPTVINYMYDIGASHGTSSSGGDGELWVVTKSGWGATGDGAICERAPNGSSWANTGFTGTAVDGAGINQCVFANAAGSVYFDNAGTSSLIWNPSNHLGIKAVDVAYGGGTIMIVGSDGNIYKNSAALLPYLDVWLPLFVLPVNAKRLDIQPSTGNVVYLNSSGQVNVCTVLGILSAALGNPAGGSTAGYDVACSDDGTVYAIGSNKSCYYYSNGSWTSDPSGQNLNCITGGPVKQSWSTNQWDYSYMEQTIFTRTNCGLSYSTTSTFSTSTTPVWLDDERARTSCNDNSIIIPVDAGTYTITESLAAGWAIQGIDLYDPGSNSTCSAASGTLTIKITAGEVVHAVVRNECLVPVNMVKSCTGSQIVENFDTITTSKPITCYHWNTNERTDCGHYSVGTASTGWTNASIYDHTSGSGKFLMVNASFQQDEFYRKRMINLVQGMQYSISFWAVNLSGGTSASITYGINDSNGVVLQSSLTGSIANDLAWHYYSLTFTATTTTADVFLQNSASSGGGCGFGLDDISLAPLATPITSCTFYPNVCVGGSYTFSVNLTGGLWSCAKSSVLSIDANLGVARAASAGYAVVNYTYANAAGCITDTAVLVTVASPPTVTAHIEYGGTIFKGATVCKGSADSLECTPYGGTQPCTYRWSCSNAAAGLGSLLTQNTTCTPTAAGTYVDTVTITDAAGCTAYDTTIEVVLGNTQPVITLTDSGSSCTASSISLKAALTTGGTAPYAYSWSCAQTGGGIINANAALTTALPTIAGTYVYTVNVTDAANCIAQATQTITIAASPNVSVGFAGALQVLCVNGIISLAANVSGGTAPYTGYSWSCTPPLSGNLVSTVLQTTVAKPTISGTYSYSVKVTDSKGCTAVGTTGNINVTVNNNLTAPAVTVSVSPSSLCADASTSAITLTNTGVTGGKSPYTYAWSGPQGCSFASPTSQNTSCSAVSSGNFILTVTDSNGCVGAGLSANLTVNALPVVTAASSLVALCASDVSATLSALCMGGSGSGYNGWSWTCSRTDGGIGSTSSQSTSCSPGTKSSSGTSYTYSCTAKDGNGCTSLPGSVTITNRSSSNPSVAISPSVGAKICGDTVSLSNTTTGGVGPYTYVWSGTNITNNTLPSTTSIPGTTGLLTYSLAVKDANSCQTSVSAGVTLYASLTANAQVSALNFCGGAVSLRLYANASGGAGVYTYSWAGVTTGNGLGLANIANTTATPTGAVGASYTYNVTVTDVSGCSVTASTSAVLQAPSPSVNVSATVSTPCLNQPITLKASASGGSGPYTCVWTAPPTATIASYTSLSTTAIPLYVGDYLFGALVLDANNCSVSATTALSVIYSLPAVSVNVDNLSVCANPATLIHLTATPSGGCGNYNSYQWTGSGCSNSTTSSSSNTATPSVSGTFGVSVTDANGCLSPVSVSANVAVDLALPDISMTCGVNGNGVTYVNLYEATGVSWDWTTNSGGRFYTSANLSVNSDSNVSHLQSTFVAYKGAFSVQIADPSGCIGSGSVNDASALTGSCQGVVLPISLPEFTAEAQGSEAVLAWTTETETDNNYFDVERSADGKIWASLGTVKGAGNSTVPQHYNFTDALPLNGINYYRLKQVDFNGNYNFTDTREVTMTGARSMKLYPNPSVDYVTIEFNCDDNEKAGVTIETVLGKTIYTGTQNLTAGFNRITLNQVQQLAQGMYIVKFITSSGMYKTKFIKGGY